LNSRIRKLNRAKYNQEKCQSHKTSEESFNVVTTSSTKTIISRKHSLRFTFNPFEVGISQLQLKFGLRLPNSSLDSFTFNSSLDSDCQTQVWTPSPSTQVWTPTAKLKFGLLHLQLKFGLRLPNSSLDSFTFTFNPFEVGISQLQLKFGLRLPNSSLDSFTFNSSLDSDCQTQVWTPSN
jgi:hypothetical protein